MNEIKISIAFDANIISHAESTPRESDAKKIKTMKSSSTELLQSVKKLAQSTQGLRLVISDTAFEEISRGNEEKAKNRIELTQDMEILKDVPEIEKLADLFMDKGVFRPKAGKDAMILASAVFYEIDYLVTWNMKDLANKRNKRDMKRIIQKLSYDLPILCTGQEYEEDHLAAIKSKLSERQVQDKGMLYNIDTMKSTKDLKNNYVFFNTESWDKKSEKEKQEWIDAIESSEVMIESRRIRAEMDEERRKDPKKYWNNREALRKKWKAQGVKFAPIPPTPPWIKKLLEMHKEELAAEESAKKNKR